MMPFCPLWLCLLLAGSFSSTQLLGADPLRFKFRQRLCPRQSSKEGLL